ncbi:ROK family transcriptional regulator [uncultured Cohaesibacter sp.]|uniref:ROK family transcriptional regulator n=1 Tax=uncultured Cohaesibacter sp. TaxID=1002546 RepID=UPI0029C65AE2|nr:ROK family transcriptional regulator [uncultured Cohaesibacter sp.]
MVLSRSESRILYLLRQEQQTSIAELSRLSGLGKATVARAIQTLKDQHRIEETGDEIRHASLGRAGRALRITPDSECYLGLEIGPGLVRIAIADGARNVCSYHTHAINLPTDADERIALLMSIINDTLKKAGKTIDKILGVGIAIPAPVDPYTGEISHSVMVPEWRGVRLREVLSAKLGRPVLVDNDANCQALAHIVWGNLPTDQTIAYVKLDEGLGGAVIQNGQLWHGLSGRAGDFGHVTYDPHGEFCRCGNRGCFEKYLSINAFLEQVRSIYPEIDLQQTLEKLRSGDRATERITEELGFIVGDLAAILSRSIDPNLILLGGRFQEFGDDLLEAARKRLHERNPHAAKIDVARTDEFLQNTGINNDTILGAIGLVTTANPIEEAVGR